MKFQYITPLLIAFSGLARGQWFHDDDDDFDLEARDFDLEAQEYYIREEPEPAKEIEWIRFNVTDMWNMNDLWVLGHVEERVKRYRCTRCKKTGVCSATSKTDTYTHTHGVEENYAVGKCEKVSLKDHFA